MRSPTGLYLDLLKKSILEELYVENELRLIYLRSCVDQQEQFSQQVFLDIRRRRPAMYEEYVKLREVGINYGRTIQNLGFQHSMIGRRRLENIESCLETILADGIAGDCIECGVWRGGAVVFMRGFLAAHQVPERTVWVADSFEGLPAPTLKEDEGLDLTAARYPMLAIDLETVRDLFERYGLLDEQVRFLPGWFKDTLPSAPIRQLSLLRLDGDMYESTMDALHALYDKVAEGGFVIVDDYGVLPQCKRAVTEFREARGISDTIVEVDWTGAFWRKGG
jgi:O-methyltransferase